MTTCYCYSEGEQAEFYTVARFPSGDWSTGGSPDDPEYENCEIFIILASDRDAAKKKAQAVRARLRRKQKEQK